MPVSLNVSIIGAGQIGSRHLQALAHLKESVRIQLVDPSQDSLEVARQRFHSVYKGDSKRITLQAFNAIKELDEFQDVAIVSTDSKVRYGVIKELVQLKNIKAVIFEKVLFQAEKEYFEIDSLLETKKIPAWVNCILRATDFFKGLKDLLSKDEQITMKVEGVDWAREILGKSPLAIRFLKAAFNADCDGQAGLQELAGHATMLLYMTEEGQEGRNAFLEKRSPDFRKYPWRP